MRRPSWCARYLTLAVAALLVAACGGGSGAGDSGAQAGGESSVRFAYTPDSVMQYMIDEGIIDEMEEESGVQLELIESYSDFTLFAGGHSDVISLGTFETPPLERETGVNTVTFGRFVNNLNVLLVPADSSAETLADLQGQRIASRGGGSGPLTASILAHSVHDLDLREEGEDDFEVVLTDDHAVNTDLLLRGDVDAVVGPLSPALSAVREGDIRMGYDGRWAFEILGDALGREIGWGINNLIAPADWYEDHEREAAFLVSIMERGIQEWNENMAEIIERYPEEFAADTPEDVAFMVDLLRDGGYFAETAYLDQEYIDGELLVLEEMKEIGLLEEDAEPPRFEIIEPQ